MAYYFELTVEARTLSSVGIVCGQCDAFNPIESKACDQCGHNLTDLFVGGEDSGQVKQHAQVDASSQKESEMEQARHYVCKKCLAVVPSGHKFCGSCGAVVPVQVQEMQTEYFGGSEQTGKARILVVRGHEGIDGASFSLDQDEQTIGRAENMGISFPKDNWTSPKHATLYFNDQQLMIRDEASKNGIYLRIQESQLLQAGDCFLCGEQIFRVDGDKPDEQTPTADGTYFYASPRPPASFRVTQLFEGGKIGMVVCSRNDVVSIGREDNDINFPDDIFMSGSHAVLQTDGGSSVRITDQQSKNGTYVKIRGTSALQHGDYFFIGRQLLRVEISN